MHRILRDDFKRISNCLMDKASLKGTRWLITGPTGMIGSYFLSFLSWLNEAELDGSLSITALHRRELDPSDPNVGWLLGKKYLEFRRVDLSENFDLQADDQFDYVFHGASNAAPRAYLADPIGTINANVRATQVFLDHLKTSDSLKGFVFVSSGEIYGNPDIKDVPTPEEYLGLTNHLTPRSCYVEAKRFAETLCWNYFQAYDMPVKIIRPVHVYGPGFREGDSRVWADFIVKAARGEAIEILSDGKARRGFCYLADAVAQIMVIIQKGEPGSVYNVGNDEHLSIKELADLIAGLAAPPVPVIVKNEVPAYLQGSPQISCPSIARVAHLAPLLKTPIEHGMKQSIDWFDSLIGR